MSEFNGEAMTHELAERLLYGWLDHEQYSWKVVCGQNPAYDYFPCQHQIFYEGRSVTCYSNVNNKNASG
eukprot:12346836-Ditylum_brightwellii.AAC.1